MTKGKFDVACAVKSAGWTLAICAGVGSFIVALIFADDYLGRWGSLYVIAVYSGGWLWYGLYSICVSSKR